MAITKIRNVPRELPHADLYLDDVEEICKILIEVYKKNLRSGEPAEPKVIFSTADRRMESIEDLMELGGSATTFNITVGDWTSSKIHFYSRLNPTLEAYSLSTDELWSIYSQIKNIFDNRQYRLKNVILSLPSWAGWSLWILMVVTPWVLTALLRFVGVKVVASLLAAYIIVGLPAVSLVLFRKSRVTFVRSHERSKLIAEAKKGYVRTIVLLVGGAVIGGLITEVVKHYAPILWK
jgi:hypothetical protein